jgi:hypothetical protein
VRSFLQASLFLLLAAASAAAEHLDEATGLVFPDDISRWYFTGRREYEPRETLGVSYSYKSKLSQQGAITCYIYRKGLPGIPTGDSPVIRAEMDEVTRVIAEVWRRQGGTTDDLLGGVKELVNKDGVVVALMCAHRITMRDASNISISALAGYHNQIIKVRFTFPGESLEDALNGPGGFKEFILEMRAANLKTLDGQFAPPPGDLAAAGN